MARAAKQPELRPARLSPQEMEAALPKIDRRIADINDFDVRLINHRSDPKISALEGKLDALLVSIFAPDTVEYQRYKYEVTQLDRAPHYTHGIPIEEVREGLIRGLETAKSHLEAIKTGFQEELEDLSRLGAPVTASVPPNSSKLSGVHPDIQKRCESLIEAGAYPEAVELSFKLVRDRLRKLTGHETGSDAFGRGRLYIKGAAAPNVDADFNQGVKFLLMAIDMFRNEKSHTSEGNVKDLNHAHQYLMISSLALRFLDRAEIKP